ncbi:MAG: hypothetical protein R3F37_00995 [Candidatus Competibacteraceae bacterium]
MAYVDAAGCALSIPDYPRAESYLLRALEVQPGAAVALYRLAELYHVTEDHQQARIFLQRYHAQARPSPESLWLGIAIEEKLGDEKLRRAYALRLRTQFSSAGSTAEMTMSAQRLLKTHRNQHKPSRPLPRRWARPWRAQQQGWNNAKWRPGWG